MSSLFMSVLLTCCLQAQAQENNETPAPLQAEAASTESQSWPSFEKAFEAGVTQYRAKKYEDARLAFTQALEKEPLNVQALTNLALVQHQLGQKGWAVALLRKAHQLDPDFSTPKASLEFILPQLDVKEIPHEIQFWESLRSQLLLPISSHAYLLLTALTLVTSGWLLLTFFGRRRSALREEKPLPAFPVLAVVIAFVFLFSVTMTILKVWDSKIPRGTVVSEKITVYSAPNEKSVALFDLFGGLEVILNQSDSQWVQVTYPGALTGWIPKASVFQTSGRNLW